jgi:ribosomal protein L44E
MPEIHIYCKTCGKKAKAVVLTVHDKEYDDSIQGYRRYGMVRVLEHNIGFKKNCSDTSQMKAIVSSDSKDDNGVMN